MKGTVNTSKSVPFSLRLIESQLDVRLVFVFFFEDGDVHVAVFSKCSESYYKQRCHADERAMRVVYLTDNCLFHAQYDTM